MKLVGCSDFHLWAPGTLCNCQGAKRGEGSHSFNLPHTYREPFMHHLHVPVVLGMKKKEKRKEEKER